jgi:hypothetical protein
MRLRRVFPVFCAGLMFASADKKLPLEQSSNELVEISASLLLDKDEVRKEVGAELNGIVVVRVRVRPLSDKPVRIDRDDFALLSTNDGQRSMPYAPSQIAGNSTLVVGSQGTRGSLSGANNGPIWGGLGGRGSRMPGNGGGGGVTSDPASATSTVQSDGKTAESPLLKSLKEKVLQETEVTEPVSGLLYFQMEGKVKAKDLEMYYKTPSGKLALRFKP